MRKRKRVPEHQARAAQIRHDLILRHVDEFYLAFIPTVFLCQCVSLINIIGIVFIEILVIAVKQRANITNVVFVSISVKNKLFSCSQISKINGIGRNNKFEAYIEQIKNMFL